MEDIRYKISTNSIEDENGQAIDPLIQNLISLGFSLDKHDVGGMVYRTYSGDEAIQKAKSAREYFIDEFGQELGEFAVTVKEITNDEVSNFIQF